MASVFISYSCKDKSAAQKIEEAFDANHITFWRDEHGLEGGADFAEEITRAIRECKVFILLISPHSAKSDYVCIELSLAHHFRKRIIPVLLANTNIPDTVLPYLIRLHRLDISKGRLEEHLPKIAQTARHMLAEHSSPSEPQSESVTSQELPLALCPLVTNGQYLSFIRETRHRYPPHWKRTLPHFASDENNLPVRRVSLDDALAYCDWAEGRLPWINPTPCDGAVIETESAGAPIAEWINSGTEFYKQVRVSRSWELLCLLNRSAQAQNVSFRCVPIEPPVRQEHIFVEEGEFILGTDLQVFSQTAESHHLPLKLQRPILSRPAGRRMLKGFQISKFCVTNSDYWEFVQKTGHRWPKHWSVSYRERHGVPFPLREASGPVVNVTAQDARAYCIWSSTRLPTALEWERAASGPVRQLYPWGGSYDAERCNSIESSRGSLVRADEYGIGDSPEGVRQMCGNVFEWTLGATGNFELRGGSWRVASEVWGLTFAFREASLNYFADDVGFRVIFR